MRDIEPQQILAHRFRRSRRAGYHTIAVDQFLEEISEYVGYLQAQVGELREKCAANESNERESLRLLQSAQRVASELVHDAVTDVEGTRRSRLSQVESDADKLKDEARAASEAIVQGARAEAERTVVAARESADVLLREAQSEIDKLERTSAARVRSLEAQVETLSRKVSDATNYLRNAGASLLEIADSLLSGYPRDPRVIDLTDRHAVGPTWTPRSVDELTANLSQQHPHPAVAPGDRPRRAAPAHHGGQTPVSSGPPPEGKPVQDLP